MWIPWTSNASAMRQATIPVERLYILRTMWTTWIANLLLGFIHALIAGDAVLSKFQSNLIGNNNIMRTYTDHTKESCLYCHLPCHTNYASDYHSAWKQMYVLLRCRISHVMCQTREVCRVTTHLYTPNIPCKRQQRIQLLTLQSCVAAFLHSPTSRPGFATDH